MPIKHTVSSASLVYRLADACDDPKGICVLMSDCLSPTFHYADKIVPQTLGWSSSVSSSLLWLSTAVPAALAWRMKGYMRTQLWRTCCHNTNTTVIRAEFLIISHFGSLEKEEVKEEVWSAPGKRPGSINLSWWRNLSTCQQVNKLLTHKPDYMAQQIKPVFSV